MDVALATCARLPEPDPDEAPLLQALHAAGLEARSLAWDDPEADFSRARLTLIRATWNYPEQPDAFQAWVDRTSRVTRLWNPPSVVRWNLHKKYLVELAAAGLAVVPTDWIQKGSRETLAEVCHRRNLSVVVVKPAISAGSRLTLRVGPENRAEGEAHLTRILAEEDALVQPYLPSVESYGERSIVWIDGQIHHAIRKSPRFIGESESVSPVAAIADAERELALRAVAHIPGPVLYARVDVAPGPAGEPLIMEVELIEPSLFFAHAAGALEGMVRAVRRLLAVA